MPAMAAGKSARFEVPPLAPVVRSESFEHDAAETLGELQRAMTALLSSVANDIRTVVAVEKALGIDHRLGWQVYRMVRAKTPLDAGTSVPPRSSMERLLKSAARRRAPAEVMSRVSVAFDRFELLVRDHAGDRKTLEAMLSAYLPDAQEKQELAAKEAAFRAMAQIQGIVIETELSANLWHPSRTPSDRDDSACIAGEFGVRRLKPNAHLEYSSADISGSGGTVLTLDGRAPLGPNDLLLPEFCSTPAPSFQSRVVQDEKYYLIAGADMGLRSSVDWVTGEYRPNLLRRFQEPTGKKSTGLLYEMDNPARRFVADFFLHRDIFPGQVPEVRVYATAARGRITSLEHARDECNRLRMQESITPIAGGMRHALLPEIPRYIEMLENACAKLGWNPADFRGYRLNVQYPVYGAVYMIGFVLPVPHVAH